MAYSYKEGWKVYSVSSDGLLNHPVKEAAYYSYSASLMDDVFESEKQAVDAIAKYDCGDCIIVKCVVSYWVDE